MVKSGVGIRDAVKETFQGCGKNSASASANSGFRMKIEKNWVVIDEGSVLPIDHKTPYQDLILNGLELDDGKLQPPCYIACNIKFEDEEGKLIDKVIFITWCSDDAKIKDRMVYSSSKESIIKSLNVPSGQHFEIHSLDEATVDAVINKLVGVKSKPKFFEGRPVGFDDDTKTYSFAD